MPNKLSKQESKTLTELIKLSRLTLSDPQNSEAIREMADHYGLDSSLTKQIFPHLSPILEQGIQQAQELGILNFTDQVWLPTVLDIPSPQFDWILCDECQDLSSAQLELILRDQPHRDPLSHLLNWPQVGCSDLYTFPAQGSFEQLW